VRIAVVGAGVAGLTAALALQRDGHEVQVYERAEALRTAGFGLNLWTNAGTLLAGLGVEIPGEPYDHMSFRAAGRHRATMPMPTPGLPHMNVERGALLRAINACLSRETVRFGAPVEQKEKLLADGADLVVAADGVGSRLRPDATVRQRISRPWAVWQAVIPTGGDLIEPGGGAVVLGKRRFYGIWRHPAGELCWFVEEPSLSHDATAEEVLSRAISDEDPLVRAVAALTPVDQLGQWLARDRRPTRRVIGDRIVAIGDAAHPMLPCIGQGACTSIEDGVAIALALRGRSVEAGLDRYRRLRLPVTRVRVASAHFACTLRRPSPVATAIAATPLGIPFARAAGAWMRLVNRADRRLTTAQ
jgi:2-polyprenyl-6-methoxyphenol hydroxylase-like FAD-dependent oxidoreductase